jgi:hypothetical protein
VRKLASKVLAVCLMACSATSAFAQPLPNTTTMSCASARRLVYARGAIVLATGPTTYDRYIAGDGYCTSDEYPSPAFVASADSRECFIGYTCESRPRIDR